MINQLYLISILGPKANAAERKAAMSAAQQFIKEKGYSDKTQVRWWNNVK